MSAQPSSPPGSPQKNTIAKTGVLHAPGFLPFLLARMATFFAVQIQAVVVAWQVYDITREPISLAYVGLAQFIPMLLLLVPAGDLIDRFNRKAILAISWAVEVLCAAALLWLSVTENHNVLWFYAVLVLFGCGRAFNGPVLQSLLPQIVPRAKLAQAIATNSMLMRVSSIGGPIAGGFLYKWGGGALTYLVCMLCLLLGLALIRFVRILYAEKPNAESLQDEQDGVWSRFGKGIRFIWSHPIILGTISLDLFAVLLGGVIALLPIYAQDVLHVGPDGLGLLRSAMGLGEIAAGAYLSRRPINKNVGMVMFVAVAIFGLANLVFSFSTFFWLSFAALMVAGAADMFSVYIRVSLINYATPDHMRGRVNAVNMLFISSSNELGEFRAGVSADHMGAVKAAVFGSICTLGIVALWMKIFKPLRTVSQFEEAAHILRHEPKHQAVRSAAKEETKA